MWFLEIIQRNGMPPTSPPLYQNCQCRNLCPDNKTKCPTFKKRICINQSIVTWLSNKIQARVKELGIVQIYISVVFPVISRLLGSRAHNSGRDWMENIFYLNGNLENGAFQPNVFDCKRFQRAMSRRIYKIYEEHSLCLFSVFSVALYCKIKQQTPKDQISWVCIWKFKTTSNFPESLCGQCGRLNVRNGGKFKCIE